MKKTILTIAAFAAFAAFAALSTLASGCTPKETAFVCERTCRQTMMECVDEINETNTHIISRTSSTITIDGIEFKIDQDNPLRVNGTRRANPISPIKKFLMELSNEYIDPLLKDGDAFGGVSFENHRIFVWTYRTAWEIDENKSFTHLKCHKVSPVL